MTIESEVTNTGEVPGDIATQLYIHQRYGSTSRPTWESKGFQRISLKPKEKRTVCFVLTPEELSYWSTSAKEWVQEPSTFDIWVINLRSDQIGPGAIGVVIVSLPGCTRRTQLGAQDRKRRPDFQESSLVSAGGAQ